MQFTNKKFQEDITTLSFHLQLPPVQRGYQKTNSMEQNLSWGANSHSVSQ